MPLPGVASVVPAEGDGRDARRHLGPFVDRVDPAGSDQREHSFSDMQPVRAGRGFCHCCPLHREASGPELHVQRQDTHGVEHCDDLDVADSR